MAEAGKVFSKVLQNSSTQDLMVCVSQRNPGETQTPGQFYLILVSFLG